MTRREARTKANAVMKSAKSVAIYTLRDVDTEELIILIRWFDMREEIANALQTE